MLKQILDYSNRQRLLRAADVLSFSCFGFFFSIAAVYYLGIDGLGLFSLYYSIVIFVRTIQTCALCNQFSIGTETPHMRGGFLYLTFLYTLLILLLGLGAVIFLAMPLYLIYIVTSDIFLTYLRAVHHKDFSYSNNLCILVCRLFIAILLLIMLQGKLNLEKFLLVLLFSNLTGVIIGFFFSPPRTKVIGKQEFGEVYWEQGRFQFAQGLLTFGRTYSLNYILAFFIGLQELGNYRLIQLLYTPLTLIFSVYESYIPQTISKLKSNTKVDSFFAEKISWIKRYAFIIVIAYCSVAATVFLLFFSARSFENVIYLMLLFVPFYFCGPFIIIYAIYIRFLKKSKNLLKIYLKEFFISIICYLLLVQYFDMYVLALFKGVLAVGLIYYMRREVS